jgi:hypothetical protein
MNTTIAPVATDPGVEGRNAAKPKALHPLASGLMIALAALLRLVPSLKPPNVAPIGALALFGGARLPLWQALGMQLLCMLVSDLLLWKMFAWQPFNLYVYGSFAVYILFGRLLRSTRSPWKIAPVSVLASLQFYLITNFGVWCGGLGEPNALYAPTLAGLTKCYYSGLPFFAFTIAGDLGFSFVLFGAYDWIAAWMFGEKRAPVEEAAQ